MRSIGLPELLVIVVFVGFIWLVWGKIFAKAGYSKWLALTVMIPLVNIAVFCWFAFAAWPVLTELARLRRDSQSTKI
jgi:hypothetical protein